MSLSESYNFSNLVIKIIGLVFICPLFWRSWLISKKEYRQNYKAALKSVYPFELFQNWYKKKLFTILNWLDERLKNAPSSATYSFHFGLMLFYAIGLFAIFWAMGGNGNIGAFEFFSNTLPIWQRWLSFLLLAFFVLGIFKHQVVDRFIQKKLLKKLPENDSYWGYRLLMAVSIAAYVVWAQSYSALPFSLVALYSPVVTVAFGAVAFISFEIAIAFVVAVAFAVIVAVVFPGSRAPRRRGQIQKLAHRLIRKLISRFDGNQNFSRSQNVHQELIRRFYQKFNRKLNRRVSRIRRLNQELSRKLSDRLSRYFSVR
ncbi:hypothetical protein Ctha_0858 [Chloroherpeton thalassium ATCC 35110]|uniref:Uncharacterized protein n=1 Tax=Chloroherpeton thalassium (strain ATCC 35110 / GB-78) TaxID=517418 RepID=B3QWW2_CHLT3|nr:hypothetical protein [Chloroherpeton thalassium]ACF13326.1 hypothetical protein Ctha_0858 [Chloroherpeton thalassium ATCC 35110]